MYIRIDQDNIIVGIFAREQSDSIFTNKPCKLGQVYNQNTDAVSGLGVQDIPEKLAQLEAKYREELAKGAVYDGETFDCNSDHIYALSAKIEAGVFPFNWPTIGDAGVYEISNLTEAGNLKLALYTKAEAVKNVHYINKKPAIKSCTTESELNEVDIDEGWSV